MPVQTVSKDDYAAELIPFRFDLEDGISTIVRLESDNEASEDEPLKLLEVTADTIPAGIRPVGFPPHAEDEMWYPPVTIVQVTPDEFETIKADPGKLVPFKWRFGKVYKRS